MTEARYMNAKCNGTFPSTSMAVTVAGDASMI
eukprot:CAMPEP_0204647996 /NCGR_PEP_ID=MMETSP0718-20130828/7019_1 /ASSEMBLY_ACC=CAM_ASM_000674 /TAXON_ID=230516 /ORGANISM="Chaetoceros curvisetus" /LENGTH=31 /DNA_ID= /DNA_START= /DNA_END= /DNA_ORIENTATION=